MKTRVFLVDDDIELTREVSRYLEEKNYHTQSASTLSEALEQWVRFQPQVVLLDLKLPDGDGMSLLAKLKAHDSQLPVIILSGYGTIARAVEAMKQGAEDFLTKPVDPDQLLLVLERLTEQKRLRNRVLVQDLEMATRRKLVVGTSQKMQSVMQTCRAAASSDATILITGETGTGKHLVAHYVHQNSPRRQSPFVFVNCATLSDTLLESDLFGHERGAFTGAHKQKRGRVELANGGTLFLDEIGEIPLTLQAKLLHFIEYGEFQRVGGTIPMRSDTRIICATNRNLSRSVEEGKFREDLFYRINVVQIHIPPLRERSEDIPLLLDYFLEKYCQELRKPSLRFEEGLVGRLQQYAWPGNVREMQNAVERAVVLSQSDLLTEKDFPFLSTPVAPETESGLFAPRSLHEAINQFKRLYLARIMKATGGNQTRAAKVLQIQRTYLNRLIRELEIDR